MNKKIIKLIIIMICIMIPLVIYLKVNMPLKEIVKNKQWYSFNVKTGKYDIFYIGNDNIKMDDSNIKANCTSYKYNRKNKEFIFNCGLHIKLLNTFKNSLKLNISNIEKYYFLTPEESLNYEFNNYFGKTISEYKEEYSQVTELIEISDDEINNMNNNDKILIFIGDKCNNIECILINEIIEKWIVQSKNIYYINTQKNNIKNLKNINSNLSTNIDDYNYEYPIIYEIKNNEINKKYFICNGFDCTQWNTIDIY